MVLEKGADHCTALSNDYKAAWLGELKRRNQRAGITASGVPGNVTKSDKGTPKYEVAHALSEIRKHSADLNPQPLTSAPFTQFCINNTFASQAGGSPGWLAGKTVIDCAKSLKANSTLSNTMRMTMHLWGGQWVTLNNRGMALHALACVVPARLGFRSKLNCEEGGRAGVDHDKYLLNFGNSVPDTRRKKSDFWKTKNIPVNVVALLDGSPTNNQGDALQKDVICTIKGSTFGATDVGTATVLQTL